MVFADFVLFFYCEIPQAICRFWKHSGCGFSIWTFYLQYPQTICGFCIHSGILNAHPCCWPKMSNGSKLNWATTYLTRKQKKQWKGSGEKDSIVPAQVQLNLHHPCAAACERQHHSVKFKWEPFELMCRAAGTRQEAGA